MDALNVLRPTIEPRATDHIADMITMIEELIKNGNAYVNNGHVLFDVKSYQDYGVLSRRSLDEMIAGSRVEVASYKKIHSILCYGSRQMSAMMYRQFSPALGVRGVPAGISNVRR